MTERPSIVGPETMTAPFPIQVDTDIIGGFGRGSSELGIPTANIAADGPLQQLDHGVYYGWTRVIPKVGKKTDSMKIKDRDVEFNYGAKLGPDDLGVLPMVMSIGWNPFYNNSEKSAEIHIMHKFKDTFYGSEIKVVIAGFIREDTSFDSMDDLIKAINTDIDVAHNSLARPSYQEAKSLIS